jgi:hypothetical protein
MQIHKQGQARRGARKNIIDATEAIGAIGATETSNVTEATVGKERRRVQAVKRKAVQKGGEWDGTREQYKVAVHKGEEGVRSAES